MVKAKRTGGKKKEMRGKRIDRIEAAAATTPIPKNSFHRAVLHGAVLHGAMEEAEDSVGGNAPPQGPNCDFYARVSAAELARTQGVQAIRRLGQLRAFSDPDPAQAEWLVREVRRWRCEGPPQAVSR
jgi:hypothetical protein